MFKFLVGQGPPVRVFFWGGQGPSRRLWRGRYFLELQNSNCTQGWAVVLLVPGRAGSQGRPGEAVAVRRRGGGRRFAIMWLIMLNNGE